MFAPVSFREMEQQRDSRNHHGGVQSSPPPSRTSNTLAPLAGALVTSGPQSDLVKHGYVGKLERNHRRYFVLRAGSHTGPSRLEWYQNQEKFAAVDKSACKATLFGSSKQGVIYLRCCLGVSRTGSTRKGHTVALYAKDQTMVLVLEDQWEQDEWYLAIKKLMEEERKDEERGKTFEEEDDGYCTLPPAALYKEVWPVTVKPRGLGCSKSLAGESRLCLTASSLVLVRLGACSDLPPVSIPLLRIRRFGHLDGSFFMELGRTAPNGPGELWMEAKDQAQQIHEVVLDTLRALRALPDFSRSPTSNNHLQTLLVSKRCRPKYRDKPQNARPLCCRLTPPPTDPDSLTPCYLESCKSAQTHNESALSSTSHLSPCRSRQSSTSETDSYMEMKMEQQFKGMKVRDPAGEEEEEEEEGLNYMMMSPQASHSSSVLPQDDYISMESPQKPDWPACSSLQTSFNSSSSDCCSPQTNEHSRPHWLLTAVQQSETVQSETSISCLAGPQDDAGQEEKGTQRRRLPALTWTAVNIGGSGMMAPSVTSGPGCARPDQTSPNSGTGRCSQLHAKSEPSVRRSQLTLCLPSCLRPDDRS